ncbi:zf-HC2 domain-containing protein [Bdellovibrionota bacterium]
MPCEKMKEKLIPFLDQALPFTEIAKVKQHLKTCPNCREIATSYGAKPDLSALDKDEHSEEFWNEFDQTLYEKIRSREQGSKISRLFSKKGMKVVSWAAAIMFAIILPASLILNGPKEEMRFPNPADQGIKFNLSPVAQHGETTHQFVSPDTGPNTPSFPTSKEFPPPLVIENVDYRTESAVGLY